MNSDTVERALFSLTGSVEAVRETTRRETTVNGISTHQIKANLSAPNTVSNSSSQSNEQSATTK
jgi:hypothetical protein